MSASGGVAPLSRRARLQRETTDEIKALAREQLRVEGPAGFSLRAIARDMGMASSAVYRYFPSREVLVTALCADAYDSLGEAVEAAAGRPQAHEYLSRWWAISHGIRDWALAHSSEFGLIFGAPVPGHQADVRETGPASARFVAPMLAAYEAAVRAGAADPGLAQVPIDVEIGPMLEYFIDHTDPPCPARLAVLVVNQLACSLGFIALETFGALPKLIADPTEFYGSHVRGGMIGLGFDRRAVQRLT
jgi:AcrR family transcriptional regulator